MKDINVQQRIHFHFLELFRTSPRSLRRRRTDDIHSRRKRDRKGQLDPTPRWRCFQRSIECFPSLSLWTLLPTDIEWLWHSPAGKWQCNWTDWKAAHLFYSLFLSTVLIAVVVVLSFWKEMFSRGFSRHILRLFSSQSLCPNDWIKSMEMFGGIMLVGGERFNQSQSSDRIEETCGRHLLALIWHRILTDKVQGKTQWIRGTTSIDLGYWLEGRERERERERTPLASSVDDMSHCSIRWSRSFLFHLSLSLSLNIPQYSSFPGIEITQTSEREKQWETEDVNVLGSTVVHRAGSTERQLSPIFGSQVKRKRMTPSLGPIVIEQLEEERVGWEEASDANSNRDDAEHRRPSFDIPASSRLVELHEGERRSFAISFL